MLIDIEAAHPYLQVGWSVGDFLEKAAPIIENAIDVAGRHEGMGRSVRLSLLVDDQDLKKTEFDRAAIIESVKNAFMSKFSREVWVNFESDLAIYAMNLISEIRDRYLIKHSGNFYLGINTGDPFMWADSDLNRTKSIKDAIFADIDGVDDSFIPQSRSQFLVPLYESEAKSRQFGCSLLTAVWYLNRLQVDGFHDPNLGLLRADMIENLLPMKYIKSEGVAVEILRLCGPARIRKAVDRTTVTFFG